MGMRCWLPAVLIALAQCACADDYLDATARHGQVVTPAYFGVHFHRLLLLPHEKAIPTEWPALSFGAVRLWDSVTRWGDIAPRAGFWDFSRLDTYVDTATAHQATVLYVLGSTPRWASARPDEVCPYGQGCAAEPVRIGHWEEYVRRVAQRYGKRIAAYELWNEPNFSDIPRDRGAPSFYSGSIAQMVEMARIARNVLDELAPGAALCTPGFVNGPDRLDLFLAAGGKQYVQAVCFHFYSENSGHFVRQVLDVRAIMKRNGVEKLPLWNTETGVETLGKGDPPSGIAAYSHVDATVRLSQMMILGAAAGLARFDFFAWDNERSGMVTAYGEHLPGYAAMQRLQSWLLGARLNGCKALGVVVRCEAERGQDKFILAWGGKNDASPIAAPRGWRIVGSEPLFGDAVDSSKPDPNGQTFAVGSIPVRLVLQRVRNP